MTLEEAFQKYSDKDCLRRKVWRHNITYPISWLKDMVYYVELKEKGIPFIILPNMKEDAKADNWELVAKKA